jgi:uncharacterized membrane protein YkvA (DUF1232 family)
MKNFYQKAPHVGIIGACLRMIEDKNRNKFQRLLLVFAPLLLLWVLSPLDILPELYLGPLGLMDDGIILITLFLLIRLAVSFYSEKQYVRPQKDKNGNDIIDL